MAFFDVNQASPQVQVTVENEGAVDGRVNISLAGYAVAYLSVDGKLNALQFNTTSTPKVELEALGVQFKLNAASKYVIDTNSFE